MPSSAFGRRARAPKLPHRAFPIRGKLPAGLARPLSPKRPPLSGPLYSRPKDWPGSDAEWFVYWALLRLGLKPEEDFVYQASELGGRQFRGGTVVDFLVYPDLAIRVQGEYFHYQRGTEVIAREDQIRLGLSNYFRVIDIDAVPLQADPSGQAAINLVRDALVGIDHSLRHRGF